MRLQEEIMSGSSQPPGNKRLRNESEEEEETSTERSVRARSISRSCLPRKTINSSYCLTMETPNRISRSSEENPGQEEIEAEPDRVSGSGP